MIGGTRQTDGVDRPLPLRRRCDLISHPVEYGQRQYWGIKDPVSLRYFHLQDEEYFILQMLDGHASMQSIQSEFERRYAPARLHPDQLQAFLSTLHAQGLITSDSPGQSDTLLDRKHRQQRWRRIGAVTNLLAIQLRGIDPERFLKWLEPRCRFLFSPWWLITCLTLAIIALGLAWTQRDVMADRLPEFHAFFSVHNVLWLLLAIGLAKILHELGHAVTCTHFGAECHEMGIMLLVFAPCLYCNVSDAWMLKNKWHRVAIGAAGMCVEVVLASLSLILWWFSQPGLFNSICLNLVFVCSVSTLLFNGNPLLRFDGYYVFADLAEIPNLRQQSSLLIRNALSRWFLQMDLGIERLLSHRLRVFLAGYGIASFFYRCFVVAAILWFLHRVLKPYGLATIALMIAIPVLTCFVALPLRQLVLFFRREDVKERAKSKRFFWLTTLVIAGVTCFFAIPLPLGITVPAVLEPADARAVYVYASGRLLESVAQNDSVNAGDVIARLENLDLSLEVETLQGESRFLSKHIAFLKRRQVADSSAAAELPTAEEKLRDVADRLAQKIRDQDRLVLKAPISGTILPPPRRRTDVSQSKELRTWTGTPLDEKNRGAFLERGTLFCRIGDPTRLQAVMIVDRVQIDRVQTGQAVRLFIDAAGGRILTGTVDDISELNLQVASEELVAHRDFATRIGPSGLPRPSTTSYQVRVTLMPGKVPLPINATGLARIAVASESIATRVYRFIRYTFGINI